LFRRNCGGNLGTAQANPCCWLTPIGPQLASCQAPHNILWDSASPPWMASQQSKSADWTFHGEAPEGRASCLCSCAFCSEWCNASHRCRLVMSQADNKSVTGMPILRVEALFTSAERGLRREILSRTSLKHCFWFRSFPSLQFSFAKTQNV